MKSLQWRHNERDGASNHQPHDCLLDRLFRRRSMKTSELRVTGLCEGNSPVTGEFPAQRASNAEYVSIWWRHHDCAYHWNFMLKIYLWTYSHFMDPKLLCLRQKNSACRRLQSAQTVGLWDFIDCRLSQNHFFFQPIPPFVHIPVVYEGRTRRRR